MARRGGKDSADVAVGRPGRGGLDVGGRPGPEVGPVGMERPGRHVRWSPGGARRLNRPDERARGQRGLDRA